jgi:RNA polymerase sigma-70 factor (ECF subfamily)
MGETRNCAILIGDLSVSATDGSEFEQRLRECHSLVYQVAFGVLRDRADAEEIAQDAFLRAHRKLDALRKPQKFRAWVARMSFRLALNRRRATERSRIRDTSWLEMQRPSVENAEDMVLQRDFEARLQRAIDSLPEKLRAVTVLSAVQELETSDIAGLLRIPEGTVRSRKHLARKELLRAMSEGVEQ